MHFNTIKYGAVALLCFSSLNSANSFAGTMGKVDSHFKGHFLAQIGGYWASQGKSQDLALAEGLVGNRYSIQTHNQGSGLVGLGYLLDGPMIYNRFPISYGIDTFFLGQTSYKGYIVEEFQYTTLSYRYKIQHIPLYFVAKTLVNTKSDKFKLAFDAGIGPNFMRASHYNDFTYLDNAFDDRNNVAFATTVGASIRFSNDAQQLPIECGYRFFYLGQGEFTIANHQVKSSVKTGTNYANALICSITI